MNVDTIVENLVSDCEKLFDILEDLEQITNDLEKADPIYERIVSEIRIDLDHLWTLGDRFARKAGY